MEMAAARALANIVTAGELSEDYIILTLSISTWCLRLQKPLQMLPLKVALQGKALKKFLNKFELSISRPIFRIFVSKPILI